ncbi:MAG: ABC transporter permease [Oscillospiraceae bacterium]|jgi:putative ABC transport system permease protein|nr:ABC transporter permease [Oscillospiraceae bacterium]
MNIIYKLTLRHLLMNRARTLVTLLGIVLSVATVCAVAGYMHAYIDYAYRNAQAQYGDWHIRFCGLSEEAANRLTKSGIVESARAEPSEYSFFGEGEAFDVYIRLIPGTDAGEAYALEQDIYEGTERHIADYNGVLMALDGISYDDFGLRKSVYALAAALIAVIAGSSAVVIANAFNISAADRVRQFGILKSVGGTGRQIMRAVLFEALALSLAAIPLGAAAGMGLQAGSVIALNRIMTGVGLIGKNGVVLRMAWHPAVLAVTAAVALLTVFLSAWRPARRAAKMPAIEAIRQTRDIYIRKHETKTSPLTQRLFGFEGVLAVKSLKRGKGKHRAAVVSLTVGIVLFVSVYSFVRLMKQSVMSYYDEKYNAALTVYGGADRQDAVNAALSERGDIGFVFWKYIYLLQADYMPPSFYTEEYNEWNGSLGYVSFGSVRLNAVPDADFALLAPESAGIGGIPAVLINTTGDIWSKGRYTSFTPYNMTPGEVLRLYENIVPDEWGSVTWDPVTGEYAGYDEYVSVTLVAETARPPAGAPYSWNGTPSVLIRDSDYRLLTGIYAGSPVYVARGDFLVTAADADIFCEEAEKALSAAGVDSAYFSIRNLGQQRRQDAAIILIVSLAGYGFAALLSLIAATSAAATLSTGMALRRREFAVLYAAGMTGGGLNKMLNLESLFYTLNSIAFGMPLGIAVSYALHAIITRPAGVSAYVPPYAPPLAPLAIAAGAAGLMTFAITAAGKRRLRGLSIAEAIKSEVT